MTEDSCLRLVFYNFRGWNSGVYFLKGIASSFDLCLIQEHWLFPNQLALLDFDHDFYSCAVSGMDDGVILSGRPFGGCAIIFRKSLLSIIQIIRVPAKRFCAIKLRSDLTTFLLICAYLPTDYHTDTSVADFNVCLGEISGFIDSQSFDHLIVGWDLNVDLASVSHRRTAIQDFMDSYDLRCIDSECGSITHTYERDDGLARSWPDHFLVSGLLADRFSNIRTLASGSNLSDHLPLCVDLALPAPLLVPEGLDGVSEFGPCRTNWSSVTEDDINRYRTRIAETLPSLQDEFLGCCRAACIGHQAAITSCVDSLLLCLSDASKACLPSVQAGAVCHKKCSPGWNDSVRALKQQADFWYKIWMEAGSPSSGVLSVIKKRTKSRFKYQLRRLKRREKHVRNEKLLATFSRSHSREFWKEVRRCRQSEKKRVRSHVVEGVSDAGGISNIFSGKFSTVLNTHNTVGVASDLVDEHVSAISISEDTVVEAFGKLKPGKADGSALVSTHFLVALPVLGSFLCSLFNAIVRHRFLPPSLRDCTLLPVPKPTKDPTKIDSYRPIALASTLSKALEWCILIEYGDLLKTSDYQFGFKQGLSTTLCTGCVKNVVSRYVHRGSTVYACFLDASKAFDLVQHDTLFSKLRDRGLPECVVAFLQEWYSGQRLRVRWGSELSEEFGVSNGVRQGGVLSPILFSIYLDTLLLNLEHLGFGCHWGMGFAGAFAYADDVVLLAPSASALRMMLSCCEQFASSHGLVFNPMKTQLIQFLRYAHLKCDPGISFCGQRLPLLKSVVHLGHILTYNLVDDVDIDSKCRDMVKKANSLLCLFPGLSPPVFTYLFRMFCLPLYGAALWRLSSESLRSIEIAFNKLLRRVWRLPHNSHTRIVHCTAGLESLNNVVFQRSQVLFQSSQSCPSPLVRSIFRVSASNCQTFLGYNLVYGETHCKLYSVGDIFRSRVLQDLRLARKFLSISPSLIEDIISSLSTN